jgi:tRNA G18 (ribose-2'-O)-methylase SpoU
MTIHMSWGKVTDFPVWQVAGFSTFGRRKVRRDIVVVGTRKPHWTARQRKAGRHTVGGESKGLKKTLLAGCPRAIEAQKHDAGLTEETDRMIREAVQNCH